MQRTAARSRSWPRTLLALIAMIAPAAAGEAAPDPIKLANLVRQDCGSCHGLTLTGTPMPPWRPLLSELDARWIADRLKQGTLP